MEMLYISLNVAYCARVIWVTVLVGGGVTLWEGEDYHWVSTELFDSNMQLSVISYMSINDIFYIYIFIYFLKTGNQCMFLYVINSIEHIRCS